MHSYYLLVLSGAPRGHCIGPVNPVIVVWHLPDCPRGSQRQKYILLMLAAGGVWKQFDLQLTISVSNGSNKPDQFQVRVGTGTEPLQQVLPYENRDDCNWAGFITKNPVFQPHNFGSN